MERIRLNGFKDDTHVSRWCLSDIDGKQSNHFVQNRCKTDPP